MVRNPFRTAIRLLLCGTAALVLAGCQDEGIRTYKAPKAETYHPFRFTRPADWVQVPGLETSAGRSILEFGVAGEGKTAEVTVTAFPGEGGGLLENVNRWRKNQLKLSEITEEQLRKDLQPIPVSGASGHYVDLLGPEGEHRERILGVILPFKGYTWFFKMRGPADLVGDQRASFEAFVKSVQFDGGAGADE
jgi:hypothetical protein